MGAKLGTASDAKGAEGPAAADPSDAAEVKVEGIRGLPAVDGTPQVDPPEASTGEKPLLQVAEPPAASTGEKPLLKVVSLGCSVVPRMAMDKIGCGSGCGDLPFDWISTRMDGLLYYLRTDFREFFSYATTESIENSAAVMYRDYYHSFWYEDPTKAAVRRQYINRIANFRKLVATLETPVMFVRVVANSAEAKQAKELLNLLTETFGSGAVLLLIADQQTQMAGAGIIANEPRLLTYSLASDAHGQQGVLAYEKPIRQAMDWCLAKPIDAMTFPDLDTFTGFLEESSIGMMGLGGHSAFEEGPPAAEPPADVRDPIYAEVATAIAEATGKQSKSDYVYKGKSRNPLESEALELVHGEMPKEETITDGVSLVSLGCYCGTKLSFQKLGRGAATLPFDWIRTSHESIMHFLRNDFQGFYDTDYSEEVPGVPGMIMYRGAQHSFWHDDPSHPETREKYDRRIARFLSLGETSKIILCARAIGTTDEILLVPELLEELKKKFGENVCLLLIMSFQTSHVGAYFVEGNQDVLAFFQGSAAFAGDKAKAPFVDAVEVAIRWARGDQIEAGCVATIEELAGLADETNWGFVGLGGLAAFSDPTMQPRPRNPNSKADDNIEQVVAKVPQKFKDGKLVS
mmetsp:Transcript_35536/g.81406  ORF Transcript_35536/g.81406 Transcript_35536/m.81406 type:complete len:631 (-) Transcript_35536:65-1957(-)